MWLVAGLQLRPPNSVKVSGCVGHWMPCSVSGAANFPVGMQSPLPVFYPGVEAEQRCSDADDQEKVPHRSVETRNIFGGHSSAEVALRVRDLEHQHRRYERQEHHSGAVTTCTPTLFTCSSKRAFDYDQVTPWSI